MIKNKRIPRGADPYKKREILTNTEKPKQSFHIPRINIDFRPIKILFYLFVIFYAIYLGFFSNFFKIDDVNVNGIKSIEISDYIKRSFYQKNILTLRVGTILKDVTRQYPVIDEIRVVRGLPRSIEVNASERNEALVWCTDKCYKIDPAGNVYEETEKPTDKVFLMDNSGIVPTLGSRVASREFIEFYLKSSKELNDLGLKVTKAEIAETTFELDLFTSEGWKVIFDTSKSLDNQIFSLKQVLEKNRSDIKEYVNLGVDGLAYIK